METSVPKTNLNTQTGHDSVNHPKHYTNHPSGVECIDVTEHMNFNRGNAVKYIWRAGDKGNEIEDLQKARWYIEREIKRLKKAKEDRERQYSEVIRKQKELRDELHSMEKNPETTAKSKQEMIDELYKNKAKQIELRKEQDDERKES